VLALRCVVHVVIYYVDVDVVVRIGVVGVGVTTGVVADVGIGYVGNGVDVVSVVAAVDDLLVSGMPLMMSMMV